LNISAESNGLSLSIQGYHEHAQLLLSTVLPVIQSPKFTVTEFDSFKDSTSRFYKNFQLSQPVSQAGYRLNEFIVAPGEIVTQEDLLAASQSVTFDDLKIFADTLWRRGRLEAFYGGNTTAETALQMHNMAAGVFDSPCTEEEVRPARILSLAETGPFYRRYHVKAQGNAAVLLIELGNGGAGRSGATADFEIRAVADILSAYINEPFFSVLRTEQQTCYIVRASLKRSDVYIAPTIFSLPFYVQVF
jgi:secreted Zn-dependent insulinase-like peptidase